MDRRNSDTWTPEFACEIERVCEYIAILYAKLPRWGLIVWTAGSVFQRVHGEAEDGSQDFLAIEPPGVSCDDLSSETMVVCDLDGDLVLGEGASSPDAAAHACAYRHMSDVGGIVYTHSIYATAWAVRGEEIPYVLTMMGDESDGPVPVGSFALIGDDSIGRGIVDTLCESRLPVAPMCNHDPSTIGRDACAAVRAAVMVEEVTKTTYVARVGGPLIPIEQQHINSLCDHYQNVYGQHRHQRRFHRDQPLRGS